MESEKQITERETPPQTWRSSKLMIDPALTNGLYKVYRYDGQQFNIPVDDLGLFPVDTVRDPRICRLWSKPRNKDLVIPRFKVDEWYIGRVPPKEVTFSRLNDNVRETFLKNMCQKFGNIDNMEIFYNPKNKKHLGIAKVVFDTVKAAKNAVQHLHQTSVMGNIIHVEIDPKGENRARYLQLLLNGLYTPLTLPVGSSDQALQSLIDSLLGGVPAQRLMIISSPNSIATPLSLDTAYSSIWQDTPCSFGLTPRSQGTPRTPCLTGTPLSQDSCYSSLQVTPILQGEPSTCSVHKPFRKELWHRKLGRHHRGFDSNVNLRLKHCQQDTPEPFSDVQQTNIQQVALWNSKTQSSDPDHKTNSFNLSSPFQECEEAPNSPSLTLAKNCNYSSISSTCLTPDIQTIAASPPDDHHPQMESLDSRIESLLTNSHITSPSYIDRETLDDDTQSQDSPASPSSVAKPGFPGGSQFCTLPSCGAFTNSHQRADPEVETASPASLVEHEDEETIQAVTFLTRNSKPSPLSVFSHFERAYVNGETDGDVIKSHCLKDDLTDEDEEHSDDCCLGAPQPILSLSRTNQPVISKGPPEVTAGCPLPLGVPMPLPIPPFPPSLPPVPPRLPNGTIPIPPPGWVPPLGSHTGIPIPPPPIPPPSTVPPPPTFLRPPPPLLIPPSVLPPAHIYPSSMQPPGLLKKGNPPMHGSAPSLFPRPLWPTLPFPRFNPFVPPPNYIPMQTNPHRITIVKVLEVLMDELKAVIRKDISRKMIEGVAFKAFEDWWDCQEEKARVQSSPIKCGSESIKERIKFIRPLSQIGEHFKKPPLPSFKVKRKRSEEMENESFSSHETSDGKERADITNPGSERAKRRHARPMELDSEDEDDKEAKGEDHTHQDDERISENMKAVPPVDGDLQIPPDRKDDEDDDSLEEEAILSQKRNEDEISQSTIEVQSSETESFSESYSSERRDYFSDFDSLDSFSSDSFDDLSSDLSTEDEGIKEDGENSRSEDCIVISSDEDSIEFDTPLTPSAPLTPDPELQDWSILLQREKEESHYASCQQEPCDLASLMELQTNRSQDLHPPSPIGFAAEEPGLDIEIESPEWRLDLEENIGSLRPLTPSGCLVDSDPELHIKSKPTSPGVEEVERPQTPGKGIAEDLESQDSNETNEALSLSPTSSELNPPPSDHLAVAYPSYQEMPRTPGREDRSVWTNSSSCRIPATPGREMIPSEGSRVFSPFSSPSIVPPASNNPYIRAPKTPGRDIRFPRQTLQHKRRRQTINTLWVCSSNNFHRHSPITVSSPCNFSESSSDTADGFDVRVGSGLRTKPLQGLENMPGLLNEENCLLRQRHWRRLEWRRKSRHWHRSRKRIAGSLSSDSRSYRRRSRCQERRILHRVWREGLDEEDATLLQCVYERLQEQDNGFGWLTDTLWVPHPMTKILTENNEEHRSWLPKHRTGSARSEGFYKISRKDKIKYLNYNRPPTELPSTSSQGSSILTQQSSLRSGSDFRSEQRRLLSSFSCDSDLVKFNQLKFRKKRIRFSRSHIHEWGLFAMEPIAADEMVIEYVGQTIRQLIADMREQKYEEEGIGSSYLFRVDEDIIIDATKFGNLSRFINHSCNPNCYAKIITVESQKKIVIYSRQQINVNEEITYDYKFPIEDTKIPCLCGEDSCRGSLN